ncbi:F-box protein [Aspergillus undulatus]|uniref:F-box protein n=1 Tax=Aspergillus undulatus TaxID=1810928 RepID=UPI003CCDFD8D
MQSTSPVTDPLAILPPELVLRVLEFASLSAVASLTAVSKAWHQFIDLTHQDAIYSALSKAAPRPGPTLSKWFDDTTTCKGLCERQTLLARNWEANSPVSRERILQVGNDPVWRFRADLKRRFVVSTSHAGGFNVTDLDTGRLLWRLPSTLDTDNEHAVRPYAHLEYQDGMVVFDREGDAVEVWQADVDDAPRGEFRRIAILDHDCQTRGFQLSYWTLCVVSTQGQGFVYDMTQQPPRLTTHLQIEHDAVGHLDQSSDTVIYSMGPRGYHAYDKKSGEFMGTLRPSDCTDVYHIRPPKGNSAAASARLMGLAQHDPLRQYSSPGPPTKEHMVPIKLQKGPLPTPVDPEHVRNGEDEWGAGMLNGNLFVGVSRAGRVFVCSDWRKALHGQDSLAACSAIIECDSDGSTFDLGGWLSVRNHRLMFEIQDRVYVVALDDENRIQDVDSQTRASYSFLTCSTPQLAVPISFMALYDDVIMSTYTTLGRRQPPSNRPGEGNDAHHAGPARIFPTKTIRMLSMAPDGPAVRAGEEPTPTGGLWDADPNSPPTDEIVRSQALLHLLSMLRDEYSEEEDEPSDDGWEDVNEEQE